MRDLGRALRPGSSALVVLVPQRTEVALLEKLAPLDGKVLRLALTDDMIAGCCALSVVAANHWRDDQDLLGRRVELVQPRRGSIGSDAERHGAVRARLGKQPLRFVHRGLGLRIGRRQSVRSQEMLVSPEPFKMRRTDTRGRVWSVVMRCEASLCFVSQIL